jgi:6-methylsalicylate decarboxylase
MISRRNFVKSSSAAAALFSIQTIRVLGQASENKIFDLHHHIYPPGYTRENLRRLLEGSDILNPAILNNWTPQNAIERMDKLGIACAINSMSIPGIWFEDGAEPARARARDCNEFGAQLARDFPGRFGMFAAIAPPDIDGSLREIEYAFDVLKLDGIGLLTSYGGKLLGDPAFAPVFDVLNHRKAAVHVHPTMTCCGNTIPGVAPAVIEFPTDTTRTIASLLFSGTLARCPNVTFIFSHGGGTLPSVVQRIAAAVRRMNPDELAAKLPRGLNYELGRHFYDVASVAISSPAIAGVLKLFPTSQLVFGSDEPFGSAQVVANSLNELGLTTDALSAIKRDNALRLFPRYGTSFR